MGFHIIFGKIKKSNGFTFIEIMVVMAIVAMLLSIALPRYFDGLKRSKEAVLHQDLAIMRDAIDHYHADKGVYPLNLDALVNDRYLRTLPVDPITEHPDTWVITFPPNDSRGVYDLHSGSLEIASDGTLYSSW